MVAGVRRFALVAMALGVVGCAGLAAPAVPTSSAATPSAASSAATPSAASSAATPSAASSAATPSAASSDDAVARVTVIHGGAGPWVVAGYRMGEYALGKLGLERQSFDLEVVHHTPQEVQYSCIADGAAAATGASAGKLNLRLVDATESAVATTYRRKSTGQSLTLRPSASFVARFRDVPRNQLAAAGRVVLALPDADIFEELPAAPIAVRGFAGGSRTCTFRTAFSRPRWRSRARRSRWQASARRRAVRARSLDRAPCRAWV